VRLFAALATSRGVPTGHDAAALAAGARAHVDHPVAGGHPAHLVLDHDDGVARVHQPLSCAISLSMSAGCRPVVGSSST
jgi:hypothetical protein